MQGYKWRVLLLGSQSFAGVLWCCASVYCGLRAESISINIFPHYSSSLFFLCPQVINYYLSSTIVRDLGTRFMFTIYVVSILVSVDLANNSRPCFVVLPWVNYSTKFKVVLSYSFF